MIGRTNTGGGGTGGILTVMAPAGVTVSVSKDGKTKRKTANADGVAVFKGLASGTWTLTITDGVQTSSKPVVITADYATVIAFFSATINITYPEGSSCTCSDGTTTFTAPDTSGTWACIVPSAGTWTVSCTNGVKSDTETVSITSEGQTASVTLLYEVYLFQSGAGNSADFEAGVYANDSFYGSYKITDESIYVIGSLLGFQKKEMVDLTNYSTLCFEVDCVKNSGPVKFNLCAHNQALLGDYLTDYTYIASVAPTPDGQQICSIDVSNLSGNYYIGGRGLYNANNGSSIEMTVTNIWLS